MGRRKKKVQCIETGQIFECAADAAEAIHRHKSLITSCCNGYDRTAGGFHWRYVKDEVPGKST